ncbi:MAG: hypothetical protein U5K81_12240 [Trueperaceae bacterium]|nr:hypothetical protein [Trueperaceae bacterium]
MNGFALPRRWTSASRAAWAVLALAALASACTGTSEEGDPVLLVVADGASLALVQDSFGLGERGSDRTLQWLGNAHTFASAGPEGVRDLAAARTTGPAASAVRLFALVRTTDGDDVVRTFDASDVDPDDPSTLSPLGGATDLSGVVQADGSFGEPLCSRALDVSADGSWLALLHDPSACDLDGFPRIVLIDVPAQEVAFATSASAPVAPVAPVFAADDAGIWYLDPGDTNARARFEPLPENGGDARELSLPNVTDPVGMARGGLGLVVASATTVASFDPGSEDDPTVADSADDLTDVIDTRPVPTAAILAISDAEAVLHPNVAADADAFVRESLAVSAPAAATLDPNVFAFLVAPGAISVLDLLGVTPEDDGLNERRFSVPELDAPQAVTWIFGRRATP